MDKTSDVVQRLKGFGQEWLKGHMRCDEIYCFENQSGEYTIKASDLIEAADTIERLRAELADWKRIYGELATSVEEVHERLSK